MENKLDLSALRKAKEAYSNALSFAYNVEAKPLEERVFYEFESARAAVIQHFEFSYELCWKMMKRFLEMDVGTEADVLTRKDLFRLSAEKRLIADFDHWVAYHQARNRISHVYDEDTASEVYETAKQFSDDLKAFVDTMEQRQ